MSEEFTRIANALERIAGALEHLHIEKIDHAHIDDICLLYTSPSPRDRTRSRMPSSA